MSSPCALSTTPTTTSAGAGARARRSAVQLARPAARCATRRESTCCPATSSTTTSWCLSAQSIPANPSALLLCAATRYTILLHLVLPLAHCCTPRRLTVSPATPRAVVPLYRRSWRRLLLSLLPKGAGGEDNSDMNPRRVGLARSFPACAGRQCAL